MVIYTENDSVTLLIHSQVVKDNKIMKRKSAMLMQKMKLTAVSFDADVEEDSGKEEQEEHINQLNSTITG